MISQELWQRQAGKRPDGPFAAQWRPPAPNILSLWGIIVIPTVSWNTWRLKMKEIYSS